MLKYVLTCSLGTIEFISDATRQAYIAANNIVDGTLSQYTETIPAADLTASIAQTIQNAINFGNQLALQFLTENVMLGITAANMTATVRVIMNPTFDAITTGSFKEAIAIMKAIPSTSYDSTFVTAARLLRYVNQTETYQNYPLSTSLFS